MSLYNKKVGSRNEYVFLLFHDLIEAIKFSTLSILTMPASSPLSASFIAESVVSFGKVIVVIFPNISLQRYALLFELQNNYSFFSIMDEDTMMMSAEALDSASQEIADDFNFLVSVSTMTYCIYQKTAKRRA